MSEAPNWELVEEEYRRSGERCREFCERRGIAFFRFRSYLVRRSRDEKKRSGEAKQGFYEVDTHHLTASLHPYHVTLKSGRALSLSHGFDDREVSRLLTVLEAS